MTKHKNMTNKSIKKLTVATVLCVFVASSAIVSPTTLLANDKDDGYSYTKKSYTSNKYSTSYISTKKSPYTIRIPSPRTASSKPKSTTTAQWTKNLFTSYNNTNSKKTTVNYGTRLTIRPKSNAGKSASTTSQNIIFKTFPKKVTAPVTKFTSLKVPSASYKKYVSAVIKPQPKKTTTTTTSTKRTVWTAPKPKTTTKTTTTKSTKPPTVKIYTPKKTAPTTKQTSQKKQSGTSFRSAPIPYLQRTEIQWLTYPDKNTAKNKEGSARVRFGGGSFHQLMGRLAIEGGNVNSLSISRNVLTYRYSETSDNNAAFLKRYRTNIPRNQIVNVACVDNCDIVQGPGSREIVRSRCADRDDYVRKARLRIIQECDDRFSPIVRSKVLSRLPIYQDTCISRYSQPSSDNKYSSANGFTYAPMQMKNGVMYQGHSSSIYLNNRKATMKTEVHELCHVNQMWYTRKMFANNHYVRTSLGNTDPNQFLNAWYDTQMARSFIAITDQINSGRKNPLNGYVWSLPSNSIFSSTNNNYSPLELSAELCALYFMQEIDPSAYANQSRALTPEVVRWIETYIVLPAT